MKKTICIAVCIAFSGCLLAQEKFPIPVRTFEQKYSRVKSEAFGFIKTGISFAKTQGVSPRDYGNYIGNLYASSWNQDIGFDGFVKAIILAWESLKTDLDGEIIVTENSDGSVLMEFPKNAMSKYFALEDPIAKFEEGVDCFRGILKQIADKFNCSVTINITDNFLAFYFKKN